MKIPFRIRIKWIRFKSWVEEWLKIERKTQFIERDTHNPTIMMLIVLVLLLSGCGSLQVGIERTVTPIEMPSSTSDVSVEDKSAVAETEEPFGQVSGPEPDLVWLPYSSGLWDSNEVIYTDEGVVGFTDSPVYFELFYDYSPASGRLAYGSEFWHPAESASMAVSDLWVYDYKTERDIRWLDDNVGRAIWAPSGASDLLAVAIFNNETIAFDLLLMEDGGVLERIATCASPSFSWSPDGTKLAYEAWAPTEQESPAEACQGVFVVSLDDRTVTKIADQPPSFGGWQGDQPIWADGQDALLLTYASPESVFAVVPLDGSGAFTVTKSDSIPIDYLPNPMLSLWSRDYNSVIGQTEGMFDPFGVWVYQFSEDMQTVEEAYRITIDGLDLDLQLIGWWEVGKSVLLRDITNLSELNRFGRALVWSLEERTWRQVPDNVAEIKVSVHGQDVRTGMVEIDQVLDAFLNGRYEDRVELMQTVRVECVNEKYSVGPPQCPDGTNIGTVVDVFPYRQHREGEFALSSDLANVADFEVKGIYAVLSTRDGFDEPWWPAGDYRLIFASGEEDNAVEVLVADGSVVRIEFWDLTPVEVLYGYEGEYIIPPLE